ncbi:MAG TPA: hypothetical protein VFV74_00415 [Burkholderiales bacterium]|nr:hypothetical protein [Burkholderiales bacterium]
MASDTSDKEDTAPKRASSWSAALAQLPGYPHEDKPKLPEVAAGSVREVSWDEDGLKEQQ